MCFFLTAALDYFIIIILCTKGPPKIGELMDQLRAWHFTRMKQNVASNELVVSLHFV